MFRRKLTRQVLEAMTDTPAVFIQGARQTGKTTLARELGSNELRARYLTLDDASVLASARADARGFLAGLDGPAILDEVQRVPDLALALKDIIDRDRRPGRFLLTGSARLMTLPELSDALVGRMEVLTLWPLSQQEMNDGNEGLIDLLFEGRVPEVRIDTAGPGQLLQRVVAGGYPEAVEREKLERRARWYESYITTLLQREVRDLSRVEDLAAFPRLLSLAATRTAQLVNLADLSRISGIPQTTLKRYMALLEGVFLLHYLPAWSTNLSKRVTRSPKLHLVDSGLAAHLLGIDASQPPRAGMNVGGLLETFVVNEVMRHRDTSNLRPSMYHFRTHTGVEVDMILEDRRRRLVGIEIKATSSVQARDVRGLRFLERELSDSFVQGIVFYNGTEVVPFGERIRALPISCLWQ